MTPERRKYWDLHVAHVQRNAERLENVACHMEWEAKAARKRADDAAKAYGQALLAAQVEA